MLAEFLPEEEPAVDEVLVTAADCIDAWIMDGVDKTMSRFNTRKEGPGDDSSA